MTAEQVTAALTGGVVTNAVNIAAVRPEAMEALAPFVPLCEKLGRVAQGLGDGSIDRVRPRSTAASPSTTRACSGSPSSSGSFGPHRGAGQPRQRAVDGRAAGHRPLELKESASERLHRADPGPDQGGFVEVAGTAVGPRNVPYLVALWGEGFYMPFADHLAVFRYADQPGMIGRVGRSSASTA